MFGEEIAEPGRGNLGELASADERLLYSAQKAKQAIRWSSSPAQQSANPATTRVGENAFDLADPADDNDLRHGS